MDSLSNFNMFNRTTKTETMDKQLSDMRVQKLKILNRAKKYVADNGYGSGSNLTISTMVALMANFAQHEIDDSLLKGRSEEIKERSDKITLLESYSNFLMDHRYLDTDFQNESPCTIDAFLKMKQPSK